LDKPSRVILLAYAIVLFSCLGLTPLWLDEVLQATNTGYSDVPQLMRWVLVNAGASPLPYLAQHLLMGWFGNSVWVARFPAALCSVLSGIVFAAICPRFLRQGRWIALILFLTLPIQFRYGLEARVYSQGLLFSLLALWLFLLIEERPSAALTSLYGLAVAAGLYSQPLTLFPVLAQLPRARRGVWISAAVGIASYLPWYFFQHQTQKEYALIAPPIAFFSWHQISPRILLHDITGGGYACAISLLLLTGFGVTRAPKQRLLLYTIAAALIGPIVMDIVFNYFFAERQLLFALPALVLLAARGLEQLQTHKLPIVACVALGVFLISAALKDYRQTTTPRDDLSATADALVSQLRPGACVLAAPLEHIAVYSFFHPELKQRACGTDLSAQEVLAVVSGYTSPAERQNSVNLLVGRFRKRQTFRIRQSEIMRYSN
jgi:hypothetical protein